MTVDFEQVDFPDRPHPWDKLVNSDGARCLIQDFEDMQNPHREPSPVPFGRVSGDSEIDLDRLGSLPLSRFGYSAPTSPLA